MKPDGGPAFPISHPIPFDCGMGIGMSLRDYFAAQWLVGRSWTEYATEELLARHAYVIADAMLAERDK